MANRCPIAHSPVSVILASLAGRRWTTGHQQLHLGHTRFVDTSIRSKYSATTSSAEKPTSWLWCFIQKTTQTCLQYPAEAILEMVHSKHLTRYFLAASWKWCTRRTHSYLSSELVSAPNNDSLSCASFSPAGANTGGQHGLCCKLLVCCVALCSAGTKIDRSGPVLRDSTFTLCTGF